MRKFQEAKRAADQERLSTLDGESLTTGEPGMLKKTRLLPRFEADWNPGCRRDAKGRFSGKYWEDVKKEFEALPQEAQKAMVAQRRGAFSGSNEFSSGLFVKCLWGLAVLQQNRQPPQTPHTQSRRRTSAADLRFSIGSP